MSILTVEHLYHGFGDRAIFEDVSFRLLKGEHIGLIGANGEGKSTFMNTITGKLQPDEGRIEWSKNVRVGYLDQHAALAPGMTVGDVLRSAFSYLFDLEAKMNDICAQLESAGEDEMAEMLEELGAVNIADSAPELSDGLSLESILIENPEKLLFSTMGNEEKSRAYMDSQLESEAWQALDAVRAGDYVYLDKNLFQFKPNARWDEAYLFLAEYLYGED